MSKRPHKRRRYVDDATFKKAHAVTMRKYGRAFAMLAAYDRGELNLADIKD